MHRERGTERFMLDADLDRLVEWLAGLRCPGVLVLGQPLHAIPVSRWKGLFETIDIITDINLPAFTQFARLAQALQRAPHDVCVLSGDVHFGRVASVELFREGDIEPMRLFEVIASPMAQLDGAYAVFDPDKWEGPRTFPAKPEHGVPGVTPGPISWLNVVPTKPFVPGWQPMRTEEHFMTLAFSACRTWPGKKGSLFFGGRVCCTWRGLLPTGVCGTRSATETAPGSSSATSKGRRAIAVASAPWV
jgi:hypothetical protein